MLDPQKTTIEFCVFDQLDSTHTFSLQKDWSEKLNPNHVVVVVAGEQTQGIGSHNRKWLSSGVAFHVNVNFYSDKLLPFSQIASYTVCQALMEEFHKGFTLKMKWPNDIFVNGGKIGGCICHTKSMDEGYFVTVGIGINFNYAPDLEIKTQSIYKILKRQTFFTFEDIFLFIQNFSQLFVQNLYWYSRLNLSLFFEDCKPFWLYLGEKVAVFDEDLCQWVQGKFIKVTQEGRLNLQTPEGSSLFILNGTQMQLTDKNSFFTEVN